MPDRKATRKATPTPVRAFWSGTISFGLVSIPVDLLAAVRPRQKSMKLVDEQGHALGRRYYCPTDEKLLDNDELVRGYETSSGKMVVITDEEFASAAPEKSRDIDLKAFVPLGSIPPGFLERPYFLAPDERGGKAYALLARTMADIGRAGIGSFVMRGHEYLVAILSEKGLLRAQVLRYANELRSPEAIGLPEPVEPDRKRVRQLGQEIRKLAEDRLDLGEMEDLEARGLRTFAQRKAKAGKGVVSLEDDTDDEDGSQAGAQVIDLMEMLRKSLGVKEGKAQKAAKPRGAATAKRGKAPAKAARSGRTRAAK